MWRFWGNSYAFESDHEGHDRMILMPTHHEFRPNLGGPAPAFELDEIKLVEEFEVVICLEIGDEFSLIKRQERISRVAGTDFVGPETASTSVLINASSRIVEIAHVLSAPRFERCIQFLQDVSSYRSQGYFVSQLFTPVLFRQSLEVTELPTRDEFWRGSCASLIPDSLSLRAVFGEAMPKRASPTERLKRLREQM